MHNSGELSIPVSRTMKRTVFFLAGIALLLTGCDNATDSTSVSTEVEGAITGNALDNNASVVNASNDDFVDENSFTKNEPVGTITADNTNELILQAFDVLTARAYDARLTVFPYTQQTEFPVSYGENITVRRLLPRACENAGQVSASSDASGDRFQVEATYSNCLVSAETLNGNVTLREERDYDPNDLKELHTYEREFSDDFSVAFEPDGRMNVSGLYKLRPSTAFIRAVGVDNFNYELSYPGGHLTVSEATTIRTIRLDGYSDNLGNKAYMSGAFRMRPPFLNGAEVTVQVTEPFVNEYTSTQLSYERGIMRISDANNEIVLTANNANANTVSITRTIEGGIPETTEEPWSIWLPALAFEPPGLRTTMPSNPTTERDDVIRTDNYTDILAEVFRVYNGDLFGSDLLNLPRYVFPDFEPGFLNPSTPDGLTDTMTVSCANGGSVDLQAYKWGARQITDGWNSEFDSCEENGLVYEGNFYTRDFGNFWYGSLDGLSVSNNNSTQVFKGALDYKHTSNRDGSPSAGYSLKGNYRVSDSRGDYELQEASLYFGAVYVRTTLVTGRFFLKSPSTDNEFLNIEIAQPIRHEIIQQAGAYEGTFFEVGTLLISAGDGNRLTLEANNGNIDTFDIVVDQPNQAQVRATLNWADWAEELSFNFDLHLR